MALALCDAAVDSSGRELIEHGTTVLPVACYHDDLGKEHVPWHWHDELEVALITEGCAIVAAANEKYTIRPGEGFFINTGILHGCWDVDGSGCRFHSIVFHPRLVGGSLDSVFHQNYIQPLTENRALESMHLRPSIPWQAGMLEAIEAAWQACAGEPAGYEFKVRCALSELVFLLQSNVPAIEKRPGAKAQRDGERIKLMLQFIHDHFPEELDVGRIAESAAVSESECLRCFRTTIGTTPMQYVRNYRLQKAALLLTATEERVSDISVQCGFQDLSYFTKTFRQSKGLTPTEYRRQNITRTSAL